MSQGTKPRFCIVSPSEIRSIEAAEFSQPPQGRDRKFPREGEISISVWRNLMLNDFLGITPQYIESVQEAHYQILVEVPGSKEACEKASAVLGDLRNLMPHVEATISNAQMTLQQVIPSTEQVGLAAGAIGAMAREATDQLREAAPGVREMMDASGPALRAVTSACHAAENTAQVLSGTIDTAVAGIKEKFSQIASQFNWAKDMWRHLGSLLLLINNMSLTAPGCYMQMFFTNVIALFGQDIAMWAMKAWFGDKPVNELPDGELIEMQLMREGYSPEAAHHEALIPEVGATTLATIISAVIAGIFLFATNTPLANFDSTIKYFGDKCRNLNNINLFFDKHCPLFSWISEWLVTLIKGPTASEDIAKVVDGYTTWAEEVIALSRVQKDGKTVVDAIQSDPKVVYIIDRLYWRGLQMMDTITKYKSINPTQLHKLFKLVEAWRKLCDQTGVFGNKPRRPPFVAFIYGESGVGKSGLTLPYAQDLIVAKKGMFEPTDLYMRNVEQEFWDGYFGQLCVIYDDCLQKLDSKTNPNPEIMEIIRTGNLIPFNLHMAVLEQKARSRFTSEIVICSSNKHPSRVSMESIVHKKAFFRRLTVCARARLLPEFSVMIDNEERLDTSKVAACDTRPYIFDLVDPATEDTIRAGLTYEQLLEHSIEKMADIEVRGEAFNGAYEKRIDSHRAKYLTGRYALAKERLPELPPVETSEEVPAATQQILGGDINAGVHYSKDRQAVDIPVESWDEEEDFDIEAALQAVENLTRPREEKPTLMKRIKLELKNVAQTFRRTIKELTFKQQILIAVGAAASIVGLYFILRGAKNYQRKKKQTRPLQERAQEIIQEAFLSGDEKTAVAARAILESYANSAPAPITTASRISTIKDTLRGLITGAAVTGVSEAAVSGDSITKHSTKATTEAQQSSDMSTNKTPLAKTEAAVSSDQLTKKIAQASTEGFASGDARTVKVPTAKTEAHMQMWADKSAQALIAHRIWNNFYRIYLMSSEGSMRGVVNGLFIRDTIMLTVAHMPQLVQPGDVFMLAGINDKAYEVPVKDCKMEYIRYSSGDKKDAMLIQFPRIVASHSDIVKHFQTREDQHHVAGAAVLPVYRIGVRHEMNTALLATNDFAVEDARVTMNGEEKNFRHMIGYSMPTEKGDCGSPLIVQERTRIRKIVGIHDLALDSGARSYAVNITQEDLTPVLSKFTEVIIRDLDSIPFLAPPAETQGAPLDLLPVQNLAYIGKCTQVPYAPTKSDIIPSALHNKVYPAKTRPAVLYDNEEDIMVKAIAKAALHTPYLDQEAVKAAANDVTRELCKNTIKSKHLRRVLTLEEAIKGVGTDDEYLGPINRRTSPGYPWTTSRKGMGKQQWLGKDENYTCTPDLRLAVVSREKRAKKGIATPAIWTDCLKDERRSEEKVQAKKTRVFSCGPQDFTILWRMYFLGFIAHVIHNRITNEQSVGTNPYGGDWLMTARKLMQKGKAVIAGDFSSFDGTLNTLIMWEFVNTVNTWYADSEANQTLRRVLMIEVVNAVHLCKGIYYMCDHSQPSGNPATTILNSFYNSVSMRMVFNMCVPNKKFSDVVSMVSYGDDNVVNIDESVLESFNQNTITAGYAKLGMTYTDEAKTTGQVAPYRTLGEVTYLKRYFIAEGTDWLCPLEFDAIVERINWLRECPSHKAQTLMNCRDCINELSFLDKETFERESTKIKRACLDVLGELPETLTFQQYRELRQATHLA